MHDPVVQRGGGAVENRIHASSSKLPWSSPRFEKLAIDQTMQSPGSGLDLDASALPNNP